VHQGKREKAFAYQAHV